MSCMNTFPRRGRQQRHSDRSSFVIIRLTDAVVALRNENVGHPDDGKRQSVETSLQPALREVKIMFIRGCNQKMKKIKYKTK